mmetsp:Transcript_8067/g.25314  ORF Transcript_8067/g.25314 Transcript_8067/m.25314 type:complete len:298 (-) Transcript_8067:436-1329(-)
MASGGTHAVQTRKNPGSDEAHDSPGVSSTRWSSTSSAHTACSSANVSGAPASTPGGGPLACRRSSSSGRKSVQMNMAAEHACGLPTVSSASAMALAWRCSTWQLSRRYRSVNSRSLSTHRSASCVALLTAMNRPMLPSEARSSSCALHSMPTRKPDTPQSLLNPHRMCTLRGSTYPASESWPRSSSRHRWAMLKKGAASGVAPSPNTEQAYTSSEMTCSPCLVPHLRATSSSERDRQRPSGLEGCVKRSMRARRPAARQRSSAASRASSVSSYSGWDMRTGSTTQRANALQSFSKPG